MEVPISITNVPADCFPLSHMAWPETPLLFQIHHHHPFPNLLHFRNLAGWIQRRLFSKALHTWESFSRETISFRIYLSGAVSRFWDLPRSWRTSLEQAGIDWYDQVFYYFMVFKVYHFCHCCMFQIMLICSVVLLLFGIYWFQGRSLICHILLWTYFTWRAEVSKNKTKWRYSLLLICSEWQHIAFLYVPGQCVHSLK